MRILHVASGDLWGGAEAMLLELALAQRAAGVDASVVLLNDGLLAERLRHGQVPVAVLPETELGPLALADRLRAECLSFGPEVLHTHRIKENILGAVAARRARVPLCVRTAHGDSEHALRWYQVRKQLARLAERLVVYGLQDGTAAVSAELASKLSARRMSGDVRVVENGIDPARVRSSAASASPEGRPPGDALRVAFVGRLVPVKRADLFIDACAALSGRIDRAVHAWIIGDGPLRSALEARSREHATLQCTFFGFVDAPATLLAQVDALAITSDHEGLPIALLEAIALGIPVVSRAVGGIPTVLERTRLGRLVTSDQPGEIANALAEIQTTGRNHGAEEGRDEFPDDCTADSMARRYRDFYREVAR